MKADSRKRYLWIHILLLGLFLAAVIAASIRFGPDISFLINSPARFRDFLMGYGSLSALIYILFHVIQVVIAFIPGEVVQIAGGYVFGTVLGTLYSVIGVLLGTLIIFFTTRALGRSLVRMFVPGKKFERLEFLINSPKSEIAMFVLFLIPGIPKDALTYIAGLTPISPFRFLVISMIGRFPGLLGSAIIGANLQRKNYLPVIILSAAALILFVFGLVVRDRILEMVRSLRHRHSGSTEAARSSLFMTVNMKVAESRQQTTRIIQSVPSGTLIHRHPITPTRLVPIAVAANQPPCMRPLYLGGATLETNEMPIGLRKSSAIVSRK